MTPSLPPELQARRDELRRAVQRRAAQLRRRRALIIAGPCALALGAALWLANPGSAPTHIEVDARTATTAVSTTTTRPPRKPSRTTSRPTRRTATTTTAATSTTVTTAAVRGVHTAGSTTVAPPPATSPPDTIPPVTVTTFDAATCHNSYDPRCGPFHWQPPPTNHGMTVNATVSDVAPVVGEVVSVTIDVNDADATPTCFTATFAGGAIALTDSQGGPAGCRTVPCPAPTRYGPWSPPPPSGGTRTVTGSFTASGSGAQTLAVAANSGPACAYLPYASAAATSVTITVQ